MKIRLHKLLLLFLVLLTTIIQLQAQSCDLTNEDFTGSSSANPPSGWIRGDGTNIGFSFPPDPVLDPAVGFNNVGEFMVSNETICAGQVCFDWHSSSVNSLHEVEIAYAQGDTSTSTIWMPLDTIITEGSGNTPNSYVNLCLTIPSVSLQAPFNTRIKWEMIQRTSGTFYLENVCIDSGVCAVIPTQFSFDIPNNCKEAGVDIAINVCATDVNGYVDEGYTENINLVVSSGSGSISGSIDGNAIDGCFASTVAFSDIGNYVIEASSTDNSLSTLSPTIEIIDNCPNEDTIRVMAYNLLNYPDGRDDCGANTVVPDRWDTLANITEYVLPDVLMVCELQNMEGSDSILTRSLNVNGVTKYMKANFVVNQSTAADAFNNMFFYNSEKMTLHSQEEILTSTRDFNKYTVYMNDPQLAVSADTVFVDFYMAHLKAGSATADRQRRADDCQILRDYLDVRPERNNILGGDLNFYESSEVAYQTLISGTFPFDDPADMEGDWDGNFDFAEVCTQSSREPGAPNFDCGFGGGNDSRFDFLLTSESIRDSTMNVSIISDSYTPVGNDGSIFNKAINDPANTSGVPMHVLTSMYHMSDHLPVIMDIKVVYPEACTIVKNNNDNGDGSLRAAIECAENGSVIKFDSDVYGDTIFITSMPLLIDKDITIQSSASEDVVISSILPQEMSLSSVFTIMNGATVTFDGFVIDGAYGPIGSCIFNGGDLTLKNMTMTNGGKSDITSTVHNAVGANLTIEISSDLQ